MRPRYKLLSVTVSMLLLSGCSTVQSWTGHSKTFRNRELDYTRQNVTERAELQTPEGLEQPNYQPQFNLQPHNETFKPVHHVVMTPPHYGQDTTRAEVQKTMTQIQQQIKQLKQAEDTKRTPATGVSATVPAKETDNKTTEGGLFTSPKFKTLPSPNADKTEVVYADWDISTAKPNDQPSEVSVDADWVINTNSGQVPHTPKPRPTPAVVAVAPQSVAKPITVNKSSTTVLPVSMNKTKQGVPFIIIHDKLDAVWANIVSAIEQSGYYVTSNDQPDGYIFFTPTGQQKREPNLLYIESIPDGVKLIVYNQQGNPAATAMAENVLSSMADFLTRP